MNNSKQNLKTLTLEEAAVYLNMSPGSLRRKAFNGLIPGAKPGKRWCFFEDDLAQYLRSLYASPAKVSLAYPNRRNQCHSTKEKTCGGLLSATMVKEYEDQLGLLIKRQLKGSTTK